MRILLATDAAREGINLQTQCADLVHFDLPWNPARLEQRNGRIDRKLQPAAGRDLPLLPLPQRAEDIVLDALVRKTETIRNQLGSLGQVIARRIERRLGAGGIRRGDAERLADGDRGRTTAARPRGGRRRNGGRRRPAAGAACP